MQALFYRVIPIGWGTCKWLRYFWPGCLLTGLNGLTVRQVPSRSFPAAMAATGFAPGHYWAESAGQT